jgi:hypothetical protein
VSRFEEGKVVKQRIPSDKDHCLWWLKLRRQHRRFWNYRVNARVNSSGKSYWFRSGTELKSWISA